MNILGLGLPEIIIIALVLLLFFGQKRLPGLFRSLGSSISELKRGLQDDSEDLKNSTPPEQTNSTTPSTQSATKTTKGNPEKNSSS